MSAHDEQAVSQPSSDMTDQPKPTDNRPHCNVCGGSHYGLEPHTRVGEAIPLRHDDSTGQYGTNEPAAPGLVGQLWGYYDNWGNFIRTDNQTQPLSHVHERGKPMYLGTDTQRYIGGYLCKDDHPYQTKQPYYEHEWAWYEQGVKDTAEAWMMVNGAALIA